MLQKREKEAGRSRFTVSTVQYVLAIAANAGATEEGSAVILLAEKGKGEDEKEQRAQAAFIISIQNMHAVTINTQATSLCADSLPLDQTCVVGKEGLNCVWSGPVWSVDSTLQQ